MSEKDQAGKTGDDRQSKLESLTDANRGLFLAAAEGLLERLVAAQDSKVGEAVGYVSSLHFVNTGDENVSQEIRDAVRAGHEIGPNVKSLMYRMSSDTRVLSRDDDDSLDIPLPAQVTIKRQYLEGLREWCTVGIGDCDAVLAKMRNMGLNAQHYSVSVDDDGKPDPAELAALPAGVRKPQQPEWAREMAAQMEQDAAELAGQPAELEPDQTSEPDGPYFDISECGHQPILEFMLELPADSDDWPRPCEFIERLEKAGAKLVNGPIDSVEKMKNAMHHLLDAVRAADAADDNADSAVLGAAGIKRTNIEFAKSAGAGLRNFVARQLPDNKGLLHVAIAVHSVEHASDGSVRVDEDGQPVDTSTVIHCSNNPHVEEDVLALSKKSLWPSVEHIASRFNMEVQEGYDPDEQGLVYTPGTWAAPEQAVKH